MQMDINFTHTCTLFRPNAALSSSIMELLCLPPQWLCVPGTVISSTWRRAHIQHIPDSCISAGFASSVWKLKLQMCTYCHLLTRTAPKRCSSSSSGGMGSLRHLVCPLELREVSTVLPSFPWGTSSLPATFPMMCGSQKWAKTVRKVDFFYSCV